MIGQKSLLKKIDTAVKSGFPRFFTVIGERGSQKLDVCRYIANKLKVEFVLLENNKIDTIRKVIENANKSSMPTLYVINNAGDMSIQAKNSLLKLTEEPPNNSYITMVVNDEKELLDTLISRSVSFKLDSYSNTDLIEYTRLKYGEPNLLYLEVCRTPGDIDLLYKSNPKEFTNYAKMVIDNIADVSLANSLKIGDRIALKDGSDGYDLRLFWATCCRLLRDIAYSDRDMSNDQFFKYIYAIHKTSDCMKKLRIKGVNRQMLFDEWILLVREALV